MDKNLKKALKDLPFKLGAASLAVIAGIAQGVIITSSTILDGRSKGLSKNFSRLDNMMTFGDIYSGVYDFLKNLEKNNIRVIIHRLRKKA